MNRVSPLLLHPGPRDGPVRSPAGFHHADPPEERADEYSISFVEPGRFSLTIGGENDETRPWRGFRPPPGLVFRTRHEEQCPRDVRV